VKFSRNNAMRKLSVSTFAKNVLLIAGGSAVGQLLAVVVSPVLTRLFTPEQFGVLAIYIASIMLLSGIATLRYELAIPLPRKDVVATCLLKIALGSSVIVSFFVGVVLLIWGRDILAFFGLDSLIPYRAFLPLGVFLLASYQSFSYWAIRKGHYRVLAKTKLIQSVGNVTAQLASGLLSFGALGLLLGDLLGRSLGILQLAKTAPEHFIKLNIPLLINAAIRYKKFPLFSTISGFVNRLGLQLPQFFLASMYGPGVAGWYLLVQRIMGAPVNLIGQAVSQVFLNKIADIRREQPGNAYKFYMKMIKRMFFLGALPILCVGIILGWGFEWIFGERWEEAGRMMQVLSPMYAVQWVFSPTSQVLMVFEKQEVQLIWDMFRLLTLSVGFFYASRVNLEVMSTIVLISVILTFNYFILGLLNIYILRQARNYER